MYISQIILAIVVAAVLKQINYHWLIIKEIESKNFAFQIISHHEQRDLRFISEMYALKVGKNIFCNLMFF